MIYTLTPNPALDLSGIVERVVPNEKAYVTDERRFPGGNAINAARVISEMGIPVVASGFVGGATGEEIKSLLQQEGVQHHFIPIAGHTRINITVSTRKTHLQTRLSFPGPRIHESEIRILKKWLGRIKNPALVIVGGSLPPGFSFITLRSLLDELKRRGIPFVVDVPGSILRKVLVAKPVLIKPNLTEFQEMSSQQVSSLSQVLRHAKVLAEKIAFVCVSSVQGGAILVTSQNAWFGRIPKIRVRTSVGAGDAMVGAMAAHFHRQKVHTWEEFMEAAKDKAFGAEVLRWGLAAACATLITPGTLMARFKDTKKFSPRIFLREISTERDHELHFLTKGEKHV